MDLELGLESIREPMGTLEEEHIPTALEQSLHSLDSSLDTIQKLVAGPLVRSLDSFWQY